MTLQELLAYALGAVALGYLLRRWRGRREAGTCCGARTCPAARRMVERLHARGR